MTQKVISNKLILAVYFMAAIYIVNAASYNYIKEGADWGGVCITGQLQSPIDISDVQGSCDNTMNLTFQFQNESLTTKIIRDQDLRSSPTTEGKYWSYLYASNINGVISGYKSNEFRIHAPAENYLDGSQADVEIQFIHQINSDFQQTSTDSTIKQYAIVSIMFKVDDSVTTTFFSSYDVKQSGLADSAVAITLNIAKAFEGLIDLSGQYYLYEGSQTIPDCAENVNWYVYSQQLSITTAQLTAIQMYFKSELQFANGRGNNRPLQSTNGRTIKKGNIQCEEQFIHFFSFFVIYTFLNFFVCKML